MEYNTSPLFGPEHKAGIMIAATGNGSRAAEK